MKARARLKGRAGIPLSRHQVVVVAVLEDARRYPHFPDADVIAPDAQTRPITIFRSV